MKFEIDIKISGKVSNGEVEIGLGGHDKVEEVLGGDGSALDEVVSIQKAFDKIWESNREMLDRLCSAFKPRVSDDGSEGHKPASHPHQGNGAGSNVGDLPPDEVIEGDAFFVVFKQDGKFHVNVSGCLDDGTLIGKDAHSYPVKEAYQEIIDRNGSVPGYMMGLAALRGLRETLDKEGLAAVDIKETGDWELMSASKDDSLPDSFFPDKFFNTYRMAVKPLL